MNVCDALKPVKFEDNEMIVKTGDKADNMYFVEDGEVKVFRTVSGHIIVSTKFLD